MFLRLNVFLKKLFKILISPIQLGGRNNSDSVAFSESVSIYLKLLSLYAIVPNIYTTLKDSTQDLLQQLKNQFQSAVTDNTFSKD